MALTDFLPPASDLELTADEPQDITDYTFQTGSVSDFLDDENSLENELAKEKQVYNQPDDDGEDIEDALPKTGIEHKERLRKKQKTADFIVKYGDRAIVLIAGLCKLDEFEGADDKEQAAMAECLEECLPESKEVFPPWLALVIAIVFTYSGKFKDAVKNKKIQQELEDERARSFEKDLEMEEMRKKLEENARNTNTTTTAAKRQA